MAHSSTGAGMTHNEPGEHLVVPERKTSKNKTLHIDESMPGGHIANKRAPNEYS